MFKSNKDISTENLERLYRINSSWVSSVGWFSAINTVLNLVSANVVFLLGLGINLVVEGMAGKGGFTTQNWYFYAASLGFSAVFILLGYFAKRKNAVVLLVSLILYVLDSLILVVIQEWLVLAMHGWCLFNMVMAYIRLRELRHRALQGEPEQADLSSNAPVLPLPRMALAMQGATVALNFDPIGQRLTRDGSTIRNLSAVNYQISVGNKSEFRNLYDDIVLVDHLSIENPLDQNSKDVLDFERHATGIKVRVRRITAEETIYDTSEELSFSR